MSKATKKGPCPLCDEQIEVGDEISWSAKGFCHIECRPKGKARVTDLADQARKSPMLAAAQALLVALLTAATGWLAIKAESFVAGRDSRDEDIVQLRKAVDEDRQLIDSMRERVAFLEGRNAQRDLWQGARVKPLSEVKVSADEVREYQETKK